MKTVRAGRYEIACVDEGEGFPLLLIHGLAGDHTAWDPQVAAWKSRHRVIAPDNRGAGRSTQVDEPVSTRELALDMLAVMDALGVERAHIVGRSMGGAIAQHIALMAPRRVASIVLCASFAKLDAYGARVLSNMREVLEITGSWAVHARHSVRNFVSPEFFDANPDRVAAIERLIGGETRLPACYIRQNRACLEHDTLEELAAIACPTLVLSGGKDPICPPVCARWMVERIPGARSEVFEGSSHFFLMEEPQRFMETMERWLHPEQR
jgi:3-oxoadipate enol-lactonase